MPSFFSLSYWFSVRPIPFVPLVEKLLVIGFGVLFLLSLIGFGLLLKHGWSKYTKTIIRRFANSWFWISLFGALLWSFTYEGVVILSMRIFYIPLLIWFLWDFYWAFNYLRVDVPKWEQNIREREQKMKWLPKRKKRA
jgi:hypothetical protein